ncbi:MAG TPA: alpha-amylase family glycosyl hydrolase, partial [Verrucomicrobiae bacterium]|nr:alpha-amylase family glycosyl hydrolase [Verrucomicrobiae bacterium]
MKSGEKISFAKRIPVATYRLQFNRDFTFAQASEILEYLRDLGISDCYASPLFQAGPKSAHGYDVCCFSKWNPQLGGKKDFENFAAKLHELGLGLLLDMVPNHMGAADSNSWWVDVLENGRGSQYANFFDIDWDRPEPLRGKVLLPVLEDDYKKVLAAGKLDLEFEKQKFFIRYYERKFPVAPESISAGEHRNPRKTLAAFRDDSAKLDALIGRQH